MKKNNVLRRVTDKFSLFNDGRKMLANRRNYILESVNSMFNSDLTKEKLRLGEAFGYYGHGKRQFANKLDLAETEIINVNGKPVVIDNVPASRTVELSVDKNGVVTHTEEILDTQAGKIVASLIDSGCGGWSWATGGKNLSNGDSLTSTFSGFDYVLQPNYISLNHPTMMLESIGAADTNEMILESLQNAGLDRESAIRTANRWINSQVIAGGMVEVEQENLLLESLLKERDAQIEQLQSSIQTQAKSGEILLEAVSKLPIFLSNEQRDALLSMRTDLDKSIVCALFESVANAKINNLPLINTTAERSIPITHVLQGQIDTDLLIDFSAASGRKF